MKDEPELRIVTHEQISITERRKRPQGLRENATWKNRPSYMQHRSWTQTKDDTSKRFGKLNFQVPDWLMPKNGFHHLSTLTASIIWGLAGKRCPDPEEIAYTGSFGICL